MLLLLCIKYLRHDDDDDDDDIDTTEAEKKKTFSRMKKDEKNINRQRKNDLKNPSGVDNPLVDDLFQSSCQLVMQRLITCRDVVVVEE